MDLVDYVHMNTALFQKRVQRYYNFLIYANISHKYRNLSPVFCFFYKLYLTNQPVFMLSKVGFATDLVDCGCSVYLCYKNEVFNVYYI